MHPWPLLISAANVLKSLSLVNGWTPLHTWTALVVGRMLVLRQTLVTFFIMASKNEVTVLSSMPLFLISSGAKSMCTNLGKFQPFFPLGRYVVRLERTLHIQQGWGGQQALWLLEVTITYQI